MAERRGTATSRFGAGRRENHDASDFYARFRPPEVSDDDVVAPPLAVPDPLVVGDSRDMAGLADASVALVVTSPPYFAGKEYETALGEGGVPATYLEYLQMLRDVFAECKRVLEPGGRIAVNVANLGRKPYRSLASDVVGILQDDLGLLLRGEVVWRKAAGAAGNCAWGSFRSPANPGLRDVTERVVIASKGRFDRARSPAQRSREGLPHVATVTADEFMEATLDVWELAPERAQVVGHPAPFPVELPLRLIHLYTYEGDLVLDPFLGSGSTAVAAARAGRRWAGYDTDAGYVAVARARVDDAAADVPAPPPPEDGAALVKVVTAELERSGFGDVRTGVRRRRVGAEVDLVARDADGVEWSFDLTGGFTVTRGGLARADTLWRSLGRASVLAASGAVPVLLITTALPRPGGDADRAVRALGPDVVFDAVDITSHHDRERLAKYAAGGAHRRPLPGFWTEAELA